MKISMILTAAAGGCLVAASSALSWAHVHASPPTTLERAAALEHQEPGTRALAPARGANQEAQQRPSRGAQSAPLRRGAAPDGGAGAAREDDAALDPRQIAGLLVVSDFDQRERNFERVIADAVRDVDVRARLAELALMDGSELAWTARLALREVEGGARSATTMTAPPLPAPSGLILDPFDAMQRRMQTQMERAFGGSLLRDTDPFRMRSPELEQMMEEMGALSVDLWRRQAGARFLRPSPPAAGNTGDFRAQGRSLSITPEGVRLEVTEDGPDGRSTRTYEAPTLAELYAAHPELRDGEPASRDKK